MNPERLGPYRLGAVVEERAFTVTYRAEHATLGRPALVKALRPTVHASSSFAAELEREAGLVARLDHDGVPRIYELVRTAEALGVVTEDPGGSRLDDVLAGARRLDPFVATAIVLELARGLGVAHTRGVAHLALSPGSIELTPAGRVVVMDFSSARELGAPEPGPRSGGASTAEARVEPARVLDASEHLAPEQRLGEDGDRRSDVFALGAVLHELLTGAPPFVGRSRAARLAAAPPPLPRDVAEAAPLGVEPVLRRCLARAPEDRYPSAVELAKALGDALAEATPAAPRALAARALAAANLVPYRASDEREIERAPAHEPAPRLLPTAGGFAALFALIVAGALVLQLGARAEAPPASRAGASGASPRGALRVLARPWAEVFVDGALVDTTPVGRPIEVLAGRHYVTFKHPRAPDEERTIDVLPGQAVTLDVLMQVTPPPRDAGVDAEELDASP